MSGAGKVYGYYSSKQAEMCGDLQYLDPQGRTVTVSCISSDPNACGCSWDDNRFVSEVTSLVRGKFKPGRTISGRKPTELPIQNYPRAR